MLDLISVARLVDNDGSWWPELALVLLVFTETSGDLFYTSNLGNFVGVLLATTRAGE